MQAPRARQLVEGHLVVSAVVLALLVSSLTLVVTLAMTGDLPSIRTASTDTAAVSNPDFIVPTDRMAIGAGDGTLDPGFVVPTDRIGIGAGEAMAPRPADRADTISGFQATGIGDTPVLHGQDRADILSGFVASGAENQVANAAETDLLDGGMGYRRIAINGAGSTAVEPDGYGLVP
jgi:hypothetical protein